MQPYKKRDSLWGSQARLSDSYRDSQASLAKWLNIFLRTKWLGFESRCSRWYLNSSIIFRDIPLQVFLRKEFSKIPKKTSSKQSNFFKRCGIRPCYFTKTTFHRGCFPSNFPQNLRTVISQDTSGRLLYKFLKLPLLKNSNFPKYNLLYD